MKKTSTSKSKQTFLSEDGYVDTDQLKALAKEIESVAKSAQLSPASMYHSVKVIPKYDKQKATEKGEMFVRQRAQLIKPKSRMPQPGARVKMVVHLPLYKNLTSDFDADIAAAVKAIEKHNIKAEKFIASYKERAKVKREKLAGEFDKNLEVFASLLTNKAGLNSSNIVIGSSMMGKSMLVKLPNGGYISIGKADADKFKTAQSASNSSTDTRAKVKSKSPTAPSTKKVPGNTKKVR